jgi:hypothetical protein
MVIFKPGLFSAVTETSEIEYFEPCPSIKIPPVSLSLNAILIVCSWANPISAYLQKSRQLDNINTVPIKPINNVFIFFYL